jgi:hypothetical protein
VSQFVLDAAVALAGVLDNPVPVYALEVQQTMLGGKRGLVPGLWHLEIANGGTAAESQHRDLEDALAQIQATAGSKMDTQTDLVSVHRLDNARASQLTANNAVYLELTWRGALPLAT